MENASKALIIAGAILLSVLIISLGIMVYNNAKNTVGKTNLSKQEIESFNAEWQNYESSSATASEVRTMVQAVIASNAAETQSGSKRWIDVANGSSAATSTPSSQPTLTVPSPSGSSTFTIVCGYNSAGLVCGMAWVANP